MAFLPLGDLGVLGDGAVMGVAGVAALAAGVGVDAGGVGVEAPTLTT